MKFGLLDLCCWKGCENFGAVGFYRGEKKNKQFTWVCFQHAGVMKEMISKDAAALEKTGTLLWNTRIPFTKEEAESRFGT